MWLPRKINSLAKTTPHLIMLHFKGKVWYKKPQGKMRTYIFKVEIEEDRFEDGRMAYHAYCPVLEDKGASTWGYTKEEALKNIREVVEMTIESMIEHGEPIPEEPEVQIFSEPRVAITV